jgi:hypothetical protein
MDDYRGRQGKPYVAPQRTGFCSIRVLDFLVGRKWDQLALNFVHALRPSYIRVVCGEETSDAICWRVTVAVDDKNIIESIEQEVQVGCVDANHGADLRAQLRGDRVQGGSMFGILYRPL